MKGSCTLVASVLAASTVALSSSSSSSSASGDRDLAFCPFSNQGAMVKKEAGNTSTTSEEGRFAPRFDGLRFIETLITAHR